MRTFSRSVVLTGFCLAAALFSVGCISQKEIDTYQSRLSALEEKGVPDSLLSSIRVYLTQTVEGKKSGNSMVAKAGLDSLDTYVAAAEKWSENAVLSAKPAVDSLVKIFIEKAAGLSGEQKKQSDSCLTLIDGYVKKSWYMQALAATLRLDTLMPILLTDEIAAVKVAAGVKGTWSMTKKHAENGASAVEKRKVTFLEDGTFAMDESMNGQTSENLREDWQFQTQGSYLIKGDTLLLSVTKDKCVRQIYWNLANGSWVKNEKPAYEKDVTDRSKDQFYTFTYLKENFRK